MAIQIRPYVEGGSVAFPRVDLSKGPPMGLWSVLSFGGRSLTGDAYWRCRCKCGTERMVSQCSLRGGKSTGCGCTELRRLRNTTHGNSGLAEHKVWIGMLRRCQCKTSSDFPNYGGRGITVCERWQEFRNFLADMGSRPSPKHSIDRFPNQKGNYEPGNCRWATMKEQTNNTRRNRVLEYKGERKTVTAWAEYVGIPVSVFRNRVKRGWSTVDAIERPVVRKGRKHIC